MNTPLRAALTALTGATLLLVASCTSASESAPPPTVSVTASAWVKPLESPSGSASPTSAAPTDSSSSDSSSSQTSPETPSSSGSDPYFSAAPLPAEMTADETADAREALNVARDYWKLADEIASNPQSDWTEEVQSVATGPAADGLRQSVEVLRQDRVKGVGSTSVQANVTRAEAGAVSLVLCVDVSGHDFLNASGDSYNAQKPSGALSRFRAESQVGEYNSGWKVSSNVNYPSEPC